MRVVQEMSEYLYRVGVLTDEELERLAEAGYAPPDVERTARPELAYEPVTTSQPR